MVVVGTPTQLAELDSLLGTTPHGDGPIMVIGAGTVGRAATRALKRKGASVHVLERDPGVQARLTSIADHVVIGDANDREVLEKAGLGDAPSVLLTTNDDAVNVYLAVYCRRLKPDPSHRQPDYSRSQPRSHPPGGGRFRAQLRIAWRGSRHVADRGARACYAR